MSDSSDYNENEDDSKNKYHYLAEGAQFSATDIDFDDPAALLRR